MNDSARRIGEKPSQILATKLYVPSPRSDWIHRSQLIRRLNEEKAGRLILLSAPAGYGKTSLLSEWVSQSDILTAWVSLDRGDNDLPRFLAYVVAALQKVDPQIGKEWSDVLCSPQRPSVDELLKLLLNDVAKTENRLVLILDDYHVITAQSVHSALGFLLDHLPPQIRLVIATRIDPPFPLARLRGSGHLVELRAADLRFSNKEIQDLLRSMVLVNLDAGEIDTLETRTEGWIAGLQMVALSMRGREDVSGFVASLSGSHRHIADYLADEVLDRQPTDVRDFLSKTAILSRLNGPLCDTVTGRSGSQAILERLEEDNLFIIPLDDERCWYRYHHLFVDLLRVRLVQMYPGLASELHRRASEWFDNADDLDSSIAHAFAASDWKRVLDLLERRAETLWSRGEQATLQKWLDELGEGMLLARPRLRVHHALTAVMAGDFSTGVVRLDKLECELGIETRGEAESMPHEAETVNQEGASLLGMLAAGRAYIAYYQRNIPDMVAFAQLALRALPEQSIAWRGGVAVILGNAHQHNGQVEAATRAFSQAQADGRASGSGFLSLTASVHLAINHVYQGQLRRALAVCQEQLSFGRLAGIPAAGTLHAVWGDVLREWNDLEGARSHIQKACDLCEQGRGVAMLGWSYLSLANLAFSERDYDGMEKVLRKLENLKEAPPWVLASIVSLKARVWLAQGKLEMAAHLLQEHGLDASDDPSFLHMQETITLARLFIAQGKEQSRPLSLADALNLLVRLRQASETGGWTVCLVQVLVLLALTHHERGEMEEKQSVLNQALLLAEPEGFIRIFLDEGERVVNMLRRAAARKDSSGYVRTILSVADDAPSAKIPHPDPLSEREIEVLRLIADGLSNSEIGERLFITTGTVKVHASNIYRKLGVSGRVQAVAWARDLNLL